MKDISQRQTGILLDAMNLVNGWKPRNLSWKPRGYRLAIGNHKCLADDLQALLVQRGYRCNMSIQKQKTGFHSGEAQEQYILYVKKQYQATVGGSNDGPSRLVKNRCSIQDSTFSAQERVWCVKNHLGTLVTRRNGKVAIVGNCGRGTRLSPDTAKIDCLVLDYGENILRHGPVDMITVRDKTPGNGDAPAKKCPECLTLIHAGYRMCPECGYEFPPPEQKNLSQRASTAGVISGQVDYTDYEVLETFYSVHEKRYADPDTPRTMRVDYRIGFNEYKSEWLCPEHSGYARDKFVKWWRERAAGGVPIPDTAYEATALANDGALAEPESITVKTVAGEKFERITGWRLKPRSNHTPEPGWNDCRGGEFTPSDDFDDSSIPF